MPHNCPSQAGCGAAAGGRRFMKFFRTSDAELVRRARAKDSTAFEELIRRYLRATHAIVRSAGVDVDDLDDVVQDACIAAFESLSSLRDPASFGGWLLKIAKNEAIEFLRRRNPPGCGAYGVTEAL